MIQFIYFSESFLFLQDISDLFDKIPKYDDNGKEVIQKWEGLLSSR